MQSEVKEVLKNPITGLSVDEIIKEKEAKERKYFELEFILRHLEDENESIKHFIVNGKHIIVQMNNPQTQYKKTPILNHERILGTEYEGGECRIDNPIVEPTACSISDPECLSCGS